MEVGHVFMDICRVNAHLRHAVAYPAHLVAQGVALGDAQAGTRAAGGGGQFAGGAGIVA